MIKHIVNGTPDAGFVYFVIVPVDASTIQIAANYCASPTLNLDKDLYGQIGCSSIDIAPTRVSDFLLCVDDDGYAKDLPVNRVASALYGSDHAILGTVVLGCREWLPFQVPDMYAFSSFHASSVFYTLYKIAKQCGF